MAGVSSPVAFRWFRHAGGVNPCLCPSVSGRYLSFGEREEIALFRAQGLGVREIARRLNRSPSTISRELRRNASTRTWRLEYKATTAQWHAERRARRPKPAKLAVNDRLRAYVADRLSGVVRAPRWPSFRSARSGVEGPQQAPPRRPPLGASLESRADLEPAAGLISPMMSPCGSAVRRSTRPYMCRPRGAAARAGRLPAQRAGPAGPAGPGPPEGLGPRHTRGDDQPTPCRGRRPGRPRTLGRRPGDRPEALSGRHPRRAHHPLHDPDPPATRGRLRRNPPNQKRPSPRRLRRHHHEGRARLDDDHAPRTAPPLGDLGPRQRALRPRRVHRRGPTSRSTSPTPRAPGSAAPTRTPTDCSATTSPKAPTYHGGPPKRSTPSPTPSTPGHARPSDGEHQQKPSTSIYALYNKPVLRRPVESGLASAI